MEQLSSNIRSRHESLTKEQEKPKNNKNDDDYSSIYAGNDTDTLSSITSSSTTYCISSI